MQTQTSQHLVALAQETITLVEGYARMHLRLRKAFAKDA